MNLNKQALVLISKALKSVGVSLRRVSEGTGGHHSAIIYLKD